MNLNGSSSLWGKVVVTRRGGSGGGCGDGALAPPAFTDHNSGFTSTLSHRGRRKRPIPASTSTPAPTSIPPRRTESQSTLPFSAFQDFIVRGDIAGNAYSKFHWQANTQLRLSVVRE